MGVISVIFALALAAGAAPPAKPSAPAKKAKPQVGEAARRAFLKGNAVMQEAKQADDYAEAARYYEEATTAAPGWADPLYNLAKARELRGDFAGAIAALQGYIKAGGADARQAQDLIYGLEVKRDRAGSEAKRPDLKGRWKQTAALHAQRRLNTVVEFAADGAGGWKLSHGYSEDDAAHPQTLADAVSEVRIEGSRVRFKVTSAYMQGAMRYDLSLSGDGSRLAGTWVYQQHDTSRGLGYWAMSGAVNVTFTR
jgi:tetratricopeptide (TPR) repeat protein